MSGPETFGQTGLPQLGHMVLMVMVRKHREGLARRKGEVSGPDLRLVGGHHNEATVDSGHHPSNDSHAPLEKRDHRPSYLRGLPL